MKKELIIFDINRLIHKVFYTMPVMLGPGGREIGAVYGLTQCLLKYFEQAKPEYTVALLNSSKYEQSSSGNRVTAGLAAQFEPVKKMLEAFGVTVLDHQEHDVRDQVMTIMDRFQNEALEITIYTSGMDLLQFVSANCKVAVLGNDASEFVIYNEEFMKEKFGVAPSTIADWMALAGEESCNIEGLQGVGSQIATGLIAAFGSVERIYDSLSQIESPRIRTLLEVGKEQAIKNKGITIGKVVPTPFVELEQFTRLKCDGSIVKNLFDEIGLESLSARITAQICVVPKAELEAERRTEEIIIYKGDPSILDIIKEQRQLDFCVLQKDRKLRGMLLQGGILVEPDRLADFKEVFENKGILKRTYDAKSMYNYLFRMDIELRGMTFDAAIAGYLLNPSESAYEMETILQRYTADMGEASTEKDLVAARFVDQLDRISENMLKEIASYGMTDLFEQVEMPLIEVLSYMEVQGFRIDKEILSQIGFELSEDIDRLTAEIYDISGEEFNINSTKQLGVILFEKLELPVIKKTKTGYSTDAEVLEELSERHEVVAKILQYRSLVKLKSTYIDGLMNAAAEDGRIHSSFNQTITATGRISSTEPNMQNIPIKLEQGRRIRKAFVPDNHDFMIMSADYSQIELRVLADIAKDETMIEAFRNDIDIHTKTASEVFGIPLEEVTKLQRSRAKAVNFGIVYGLSDFGLSKDIKTSIKEARQYIENYFNRYQGVKRYLEEAIKSGREHGYVSTLMNRIRFIPEINATNRNVKLFGERLAMNTPIQGTAADIIKIAMVQVYRRMTIEGLRSKLILQVHDELVLNVHKDEYEYVKAMLKLEMESALKLQVPLIVDIKWGNSWYEAK